MIQRLRYLHRVYIWRSESGNFKNSRCTISSFRLPVSIGYLASGAFFESFRCGRKITIRHFSNLRFMGYTSILICMTLGFLAACSAAYFQKKNNSDGTFISACAAAGLILITGLFQFDQQNRDGAKIKEQQDYINNYISGGKDNKPIFYFTEHIQPEDSCINISFNLINTGKFPLQNIYYQLTDEASLICDFTKLHPWFDKDTFSLPITKEQEDTFSKFQNSYEYLQQKEKFGNIPNLPTMVGQTIQNCKLPRSCVSTRYIVSVGWNNQHYMATLVLTASNDKKKLPFKLSKLQILNESMKAQPDLLEFFPTMSESFLDEYLHGISKNLDTSNSITPTTHQYY